MKKPELIFQFNILVKRGAKKLAYFPVQGIGPGNKPVKLGRRTYLTVVIKSISAIILCGIGKGISVAWAEGKLVVNYVGKGGVTGMFDAVHVYFTDTCCINISYVYQIK